MHVMFKLTFRRKKYLTKFPEIRHNPALEKKVRKEFKAVTKRYYSEVEKYNRAQEEIKEWERNIALRRAYLNEARPYIGRLGIEFEKWVKCDIDHSSIQKLDIHSSIDKAEEAVAHYQEYIAKELKR